MAENLRVAIVGLGLIGLRHAAAIDQVDHVDLVAIVDPDTTSQHAAKARGWAAYCDIRACLEAEKLDGVIIATPTLLHVAQAKVCVESGIPMLIEKPIAVQAIEAESLVVEAAKKDVPILVGHHRRHNPLIQKAKQAIDEGLIGTPNAINVMCWFYKPDHYFEKAPWRTQKGAGPISVNLVHDIDLMRYLLGSVASVQALAKTSARGFENEELASAVLRFESGAVGCLSVSDSIAAPWSWELTANENPVYPATNQSCYQIGGSEGSLSIPDLKVWRHDGTEPDWWSPMSAKSLTHEATDPLVAQIQHFARVMSGAESPLVSGVEGLRTLQVVEAMQNAAENEHKVEIKPFNL